MTRVAVVTADVLGARMAGPAIRAWNIAHQLAGGHDVLLVSTAECTVTSDTVDCRFVSWASLERELGDVPVVVAQGFVTFHAPWLVRSDKVLVIDLYDPVHLEQLEELRERPILERRATLDHTVRVLNEQAVRGDFFLCASEEQRHLWLGMLAALGRVNPATYDADPTLTALLAVCPFGLPSAPPERTRPALRGVVPGIGAEDKVVLWAGGVYNWFDPLTLLHALDRLRRRRPEVRLFFLGMQHPNPDVPEMAMAASARRLSDELGLTGTSVFFNDSWVDYEDRQNYLLDADLGVSTHFAHVETTFAFRTRILDYLWAGLPVVCTSGDAFGRLVAERELGVAVPERDVAALEAALERLLYDEAAARAARDAVARARTELVWERALAPLVEFCADPRRAPDAHEDRLRMARAPIPPQGALGRGGVRAVDLLRQGGPVLVAKRLAAWSGRQVRERRR